MRPYVICHMYVSIDGRIDGKYMEEEGCDISGTYYDEKIFKVGTSMASGRVTTKLYEATEPMDLSDYSSYAGKGDFFLPSSRYYFVFDRMGKCFYPSSTYSYGGATMQIVEVISPQCDKRYFSYLKEKKIGYIIANSIQEALTKIDEEFHVKRLVLTGGSTINGGFLKEDCIDEISLIMAPYIEGNVHEKTAFTLEKYCGNKFCFKEAKPLEDGGVELILLRDKK